MDNPKVVIIPNDRGNPPGKLADIELHFTGGLFADLKLIGFSIWERQGLRTVTFPARSYAVNGERRSFALLRPTGAPTSNPGDSFRVRDYILAAYADNGKAESIAVARFGSAAPTVAAAVAEMALPWPFGPLKNPNSTETRLGAPDNGSNSICAPGKLARSVLVAVCCSIVTTPPVAVRRSKSGKGAVAGVWKARTSAHEMNRTVRIAAP
jgi:hypothetical protein